MRAVLPVALLLLSTAAWVYGAVKFRNRQVRREDIEWTDVWMPDMNRHDLPGVLLIGDSITRAYYKGVEQ